MARKGVILDAERDFADDAETTPIAGQIMQIGDADSEAAWDEWISALKNNDAAGTVRAHRLPVDGDGNPMLGKGTRQVYLGSWPHQLYAFDDLLAKITKEFLKPGELAHIKLTGTAAGVRGQMFARIVTLQRADAPVDQTTSGGETVGQLFKVMQESQQAQLAVMRELMTPAPIQQTTPARSGMEVVKDIAGIVTPLLAPAIAAMIARPPAPRSELADLIGAMAQLKDFMGGENNRDDSDSPTIAIVKAVAPALPQLLQLLNQTPPAPALARPMLPRPRPNPTADLTAPTQTPNPAPASPSPMSQDMLDKLAPQIDQLATLAEQKADPVEVAKLTLQMLPAEIYDKLADLVADPAAFARLSLLAPRMKAHAAWFEQLRVALENELFEPDPPGDSSQSAPQ